MDKYSPYKIGAREYKNIWTEVGWFKRGNGRNS